MSLQKPLWLYATFQKRKGKRTGVRVNEWVDGEYRRVAKWGPYSDQKRVRKAVIQADTMCRRLNELWPCTFLVKGYDYRPPAHLPDPPAHLVKEAVMTNEPTIEKGVPIPKHRRNKAKWGNIFATMKVGESFAVPDRKVLSLRGAIKHHIKFHANFKRWVVQRDTDGHYRCWRTK